MTEFLSQYKDILITGTLETLYMTFVSTIFAYVIGLPLGVIMVITDKKGIMPNKAVNSILGTIINIGRSIPFIILMVALIPFTRFIVGKAIGSTAAIVPLTIAAAPFVARMVESSVREVNSGVIEAAQSMGSTNFQIIWKVLLPEALPSLINGAAVSITTILAYTAMVSAVGGGGVGSYAITKGYQRGKKYYNFMYVASAVLVLMVQIITITGTWLTRRLDHRIR